MVKKKLPAIKKSLIDFATKEDAKVMDKAFTKVALVGSVLILGTISEVNAGSHTNHANELTIPGYDILNNEFPDGKQSGGRVNDDEHEARNQLREKPNLFNPTNDVSNPPVYLSNLPSGYDGDSGSEVISVPAKTVVAHHANHYNKITWGSGGGNC